MGPRRYAVLGLGAVLVALAVILGYLAALDVRVHRALDRATARAEAVVVSVDEDDDTYFSARWRDAQEQEHTQRFSTYDSYQEGDRFSVAYDPARPGNKAFPADPEDRTDLDDVEVPMAIATLVALGSVGGWGYRWWRFRQVRKQPPVPVQAALFSGAASDGSPMTFGRGLWLRLGSESWQKVMWHPALHDFTQGTVMVHGGLGRRRRVVPELAGGVLLVPSGRQRRHPPGNVDLVREHHARVDDEQWIFPAGTMVPPQSRWWRQPALLGLVAVAVGSVAGLVIGDVRALPVMAAGFAGLAVNGWAMMGPRPDQ